ncbi:MAG: four-helix bundle copper-binding protein [Ignavibacteriales bacterium]
MQKNDSLIQTMLECVRTCEMCADACLHEENVKMLSRCIKLDMDCADICTVGARLIQRNSEIAPKFIQMCADVCKMCEEECEKHQDMHKHCKMCADACRKCYNECKSYREEKVSDEEMR